VGLVGGKGGGVIWGNREEGRREGSGVGCRERRIGVVSGGGMGGVVGVRGVVR